MIEQSDRKVVGYRSSDSTTKKKSGNKIKTGLIENKLQYYSLKYNIHDHIKCKWFNVLIKEQY